MPAEQTELDVARAVRDGDLSSPQKFSNVWLFALRITGTGEAERRALNEVVRRDPNIFLTEAFLERCQGLPVIIGHPKNQVLDSREFAERAVGAVMLPYIQGDEVWGIARIYDADAAGAMEKLELSTSPAVVLRKGESERVDLKDGKHLLIEGEPYLLDHVAVVPVGVWDKGELGSGIERSDSNMADESNETERGEQGHEGEGSHSGTELDKQLKKITDGVTRMLDSLEHHGRHLADLHKRVDRLEGGRGRDDRRRVDDPDTRREPGQAKQVVADWTEDRDPDWENRMTEAQSKADAAYVHWGERAPKFLRGESLLSFRRRLLKPHQKHSERYKGALLDTITDAAIFKEVEDQIFADSMAAAINPEAIGSGHLRMVSKRTDAGHTINTFYGDPGAWMSYFMPAGRAVTKFKTKDGF